MRLTSNIFYFSLANWVQRDVEGVDQRDLLWNGSM